MIIDLIGILFKNTVKPFFASDHPQGGDRISSAVTLYSEDFESSSLPTEWNVYNGGTLEIITDTAQTFIGSAGSAKAIYPQPTTGNVYAIGSYDLTDFCSLGETNHIYIDFYAKMPNSKQGLKFCKFFGHSNEGAPNGANTTFGLDYTGTERGGMTYVAFGDGDPLTDSIANDTANGVWLAGTNDPDAPYHGAGRSIGEPGNVILTPQNSNWLASNWGTTWHRFQFYVKFNSGTTQENEINDGEIKVIVDGVTYVDAVGLYNRHYSNGPLDHVNLMEYAQTGTSGFDIWMDSIRISQYDWTR